MTSANFLSLVASDQARYLEKRMYYSSGVNLSDPCNTLAFCEDPVLFPRFSWPGARCRLADVLTPVNVEAATLQAEHKHCWNNVCQGRLVSVYTLHECSHQIIAFPVALTCIPYTMSRLVYLHTLTNDFNNRSALKAYCIQKGEVRSAASVDQVTTKTWLDKTHYWNWKHRISKAIRCK